MRLWLLEKSRNVQFLCGSNSIGVWESKNQVQTSRVWNKIQHKMYTIITHRCLQMFTCIDKYSFPSNVKMTLISYLQFLFFPWSTDPFLLYPRQCGIHLLNWFSWLIVEPKNYFVNKGITFCLLSVSVKTVSAHYPLTYTEGIKPYLSRPGNNRKSLWNKRNYIFF